MMDIRLMFATSGKRPASAVQVSEDKAASTLEQQDARVLEEGPSKNSGIAVSPKAKLVRLGQSACGCSDLSLILPDQPFHPTTIPETLPTQSRILKGKVICLKFSQTGLRSSPFFITPTT